MSSARARRAPILLLTALFLLFPYPSVATATPDTTAAAPFGEFAPGEVVVSFRPGVSAAAKADLRRAHGARVATTVGDVFEVLELGRGRAVAATVRALEANPLVRYAEPNFIYRSFSVPNDPQFGEQWALNSPSDADIDAPEAWDIAEGSPSVVVAVVDSGVAHDHIDLVSNMWTNQAESGPAGANGADDDGNGYADDTRGWDFIGDDPSPLDLDGHGTHVAGTLAAASDNGTGIAGVAGKASILPLRALDSFGAGRSADIAAAFRYAGVKGAAVVNASFGGAVSQAVADAVGDFPNTLFVAAAGNESSDNDARPLYPCNVSQPNVVCVTASDTGDGLPSFANTGATSVDLAAPGVSILGPLPLLTRVYTESFSADIGSSWTTGGMNNAWARSSGERGGYLADSPHGPYLPLTDSWAQPNASLDLSGKTSCVLEYFMRLDTEPNRDGVRVEARTAGGAWSRVAAWSGSTGGEWEDVSSNLSAFDGLSGVQVRFRLISDALQQQAGVDLDDISVRCVVMEASSRYGYGSGTSMAAPHVSGAAVVLRAHKPDASAATVRAALLEGSDMRPAFAGRTVSGGRLNLFGALAALDPAVAALATTSPSPSETATPTPTPTPVTSSRDPSPSAPTATPTPGTTPSSTAGSPEATASPTNPAPTQTDASPSSAPTPISSPPAAASPSPSPSTSEPGALFTNRAITLRLSRDLVVSGRVIAAGASSGPCVSGVEVKIKRGLRTVAVVRTSADGLFKVRVRPVSGRYVAKVPQTAIGEVTCSRARSSSVRYRG